jgi:hypothetical protein
VTKNLRTISEEHWNSDSSSFDAINCGSLQRIADACELTAKNYRELLAERDNYQKWYREQRARVEARDRSIAALRGQITKLRKKLGAGNA